MSPRVHYFYLWVLGLTYEVALAPNRFRRHSEGEFNEVLGSEVVP